MLHERIKGTTSAIYSILYAARAQYGIYCLGTDILPLGKNWPILLATHNMCDHYLPSPKNGRGRDRAV